MLPATLLLLSSAAAGGPAADAAPAPPAAAFLERHCADCHGEWVQEGGLNFAELSRDLDDPAAARVWARGHDRVVAGEMPPPDAGPVPDGERAAAAAAWAAWLADHDRGLAAAHGRAAVRRLSRREFEAAAADLLALPRLSVRHVLPPEGTADGFDKSAEALELSPAFLESVLEAADAALRAAVETDERPPERRTVRATVAHDGPDLTRLQEELTCLYDLLQVGTAAPLLGDSPRTLRLDPTLDVDMWDFATGHDGHVKDPAPHFDGVGVVEWEGEADWLQGLQSTAAGLYRIRLHGFAYEVAGGEPRPTDRPAAVTFLTAHAPVATLTVPHEGAATAEAVGYMGANLSLRLSVASAVPWRLNWWEGDRHGTHDLPGVVVRWIELEGPLDEHDGAWPPPSHAALFGEDVVGWPAPADGAAEGDRLIDRFLARALRRPATAADAALPRRVLRDRLDAGEPFLHAVLAAYRAVLCSPDFLLVRADTGAAAGTPGGGPLTPHALAERLALFLTDGLPDDPLRAAADDGTLADPAVLAAHARRLLADPRSRRFVDHFLDHWLNLADVDVTEPDENLYPEWKPLLAAAVAEEPRALFRLMLDRDLPASATVAGDVCVLNQPLAELYGVPGVDGAEFRPVPVPADGDGAVRGGLLTTAAVLKVTANGTTTSPVTRGAFVAERFLADPPPPPPPAVPAVEPDISGAKTIREQLAKHRADPACAGCHAKLDPPGFALEEFDAIGRRRDRYRSLGAGDPGEGLNQRARPVYWKHGLPVDASGTLLGGAAFEGAAGFRAELAKDPRRLAAALLHHLVPYATGAPVRFGDRAAAEEVLDAAEPSGYGVRTLIVELVKSPLFRHR